MIIFAALTDFRESMEVAGRSEHTIQMVERAVVALTTHAWANKPENTKGLALTDIKRADIVPVSVLTGQGIDDLRARLAAAAKQVSKRPAEGRFRLAGLNKTREHLVTFNPPHEGTLMMRTIRVPDSEGLTPVRADAALSHGIIQELLDAGKVLGVDDLSDAFLLDASVFPVKVLPHLGSKLLHQSALLLLLADEASIDEAVDQVGHHGIRGEDHDARHHRRRRALSEQGQDGDEEDSGDPALLHGAGPGRRLGHSRARLLLRPAAGAGLRLGAAPRTAAGGAPVDSAALSAAVLAPALLLGLGHRRRG